MVGSWDTQRTKSPMILFGIVLIVVGLVGISVPIIYELSFSWNCEEYIKRAADSASPERCGEELDKAIAYAKENDLTYGNTGIIFRTPKGDVGFWYNNLLSARQALKEVENKDGEAKPNALERSNVLIRVRETLVDQGNDVEVTLPPRISFYPHVLLILTLMIGGIIIAGAGALVTLSHWND